MSTTLQTRMLRSSSQLWSSCERQVPDPGSKLVSKPRLRRLQLAVLQIDLFCEHVSDERTFPRMHEQQLQTPACSAAGTADRAIVCICLRIIRASPVLRARTPPPKPSLPSDGASAEVLAQVHGIRQCAIHRSDMLRRAEVGEAVPAAIS